MVQFSPIGHKYESITPDGMQWLGITTLISALKQPFDRETRAQKSSTRVPSADKPNKWYGIPAEEIKQAWDNESKRSTELGSWYHDKFERSLYTDGHSSGLTVYKPNIVDGIKYASDQRLSEGIYPEHLCYMASLGICGQSDMVIVKQGHIHIEDHKSSKEIQRRGYMLYDGIRKKMLKPIEHIEDCHLNHYSLQLSMYMYMIIRNNPHLVPGTLTLNHVKFEEGGQDKYGYPIYRRDDNNEPVVRDIERIECRYMKSEVQKIIEWLKDGNRDKILKHKNESNSSSITE